MRARPRLPALAPMPAPRTEAEALHQARMNLITLGLRVELADLFGDTKAIRRAWRRFGAEVGRLVAEQAPPEPVELPEFLQRRRAA